MRRTDEAPRPFELLLPELTIALWIFLIAGLTVLGSDLHVGRGHG